MSELKHGNAVNDGKRLLDSYLAAEQELERCKDALNRAECDFRNAENSLGKWLCPESAKTDEKFSIWHLGNFIDATKQDAHTFKITIRQRARP